MPPLASHSCRPAPSSTCSAGKRPISSPIAERTARGTLAPARAPPRLQGEHLSARSEFERSRRALAFR
ncbi:hypothetical protein RHECNPAF_470011 [Rhizobium etli CNPAF512]|nr:hypothetical protein RHECNPAF_470011 [Rhizobium etli CNPAF512]